MRHHAIAPKEASRGIDEISDDEAPDLDEIRARPDPMRSERLEELDDDLRVGTRISVRSNLAYDDDACGGDGSLRGGPPPRRSPTPRNTCDVTQLRAAAAPYRTAQADMSGCGSSSCGPTDDCDRLRRVGRLLSNDWLFNMDEAA